jgi:hypothetical protein
MKAQDPNQPLLLDVDQVECPDCGLHMPPPLSRCDRGHHGARKTSDTLTAMFLKVMAEIEAERPHHIEEENTPC